MHIEHSEKPDVSFPSESRTMNSAEQEEIRARENLLESDNATFVKKFVLCEKVAYLTS